MRFGWIAGGVAVLGACTLGLACGGDSDGGGGATPSAGTGGGGVSCEADGICQPVCATDPDCASTGGSAGSGGGTATGGDGGTPPSGGAGPGGTGGEPVGGASGAGGEPVGGSGGSAPSGEVGELGSPCAPSAALACAGNYQKVTLICGASGTWEANETCPGTQICDTRPGLTAGTCEDQDAACIDHEPGYRFCSDNNVQECGPDNLDYSEVEQCTGVCEVDVCNNDCPGPAELIANCADDCGGMVGCYDSYALWPELPDCFFSVAPITGAIGDRLVVRMPAAQEGCQCDTSDRYDFSISEQTPTLTIRVTAPAPWGVLDVSDGDLTGTCTGDTGSACLVSPVPSAGASRDVRLVTDEQTLGPQNVIVEIVDQNATCP